MKTCIHILVVVLLAFGKLTAQSQGEEIFTIVEEMAEFPGGNIAMKNYIAENLSYPADAAKAGLQGKCFVKFIVDKTGSINRVEVIKGVPGCPECDKEAVRVVKSMPLWKPGKMNGQAVNVFYNLPILFKLKEPVSPAEGTKTDESLKKNEK